jgi:hypothetical protein
MSRRVALARSALAHRALSGSGLLSIHPPFDGIFRQMARIFVLFAFIRLVSQLVSLSKRKCKTLTADRVIG